MRPIVVFAAIAYALSIGLSLVVGLTGGYQSLSGLRYLSMFLPALSVLIVHAAMGEGPKVDWERLPLKYVPAALLLIP